HRLHDPALHAFAAAMDQPNAAQPGFVCRAQVLFDHRGDIGRGEGVQIELSLNRNVVGIVAQAVFTYSATTVVVIPPRAVNAPVPVTRLAWQAPTSSS